MIMNFLPDKYTSYTSYTNPEVYSYPDNLHNCRVKSLFVSYDINTEPMLILDHSDSVINTTFKNEDIKIFHSINNFHFYYEPILQLSQLHVNTVIMSLLRQHIPSFLNNISGNVLIFGSVNPFTNSLDGNDYSVPHEIVEQVVRIYDIHSKHKS